MVGWDEDGGIYRRIQNCWSRTRTRPDKRDHPTDKRPAQEKVDQEDRQCIRMIAGLRDKRWQEEQSKRKRQTHQRSESDKCAQHLWLLSMLTTSEGCFDSRMTRAEHQWRTGDSVQLSWEGKIASFEVLHLLTRLFNFRFQTQTNLRYLRASAGNAGGLREHGIGLPVHLLQ